MRRAGSGAPENELHNCVNAFPGAFIAQPHRLACVCRLWVAHTVKDRQWGYSTRIGGSFDLGRLTNWVADFVDYNVRGKGRGDEA
jgi:hypothetical protein